MGAVRGSALAVGGEGVKRVMGASWNHFFWDFPSFVNGVCDFYSQPVLGLETANSGITNCIGKMEFRATNFAYYISLCCTGMGYVVRIRQPFRVLILQRH